MEEKESELEASTTSTTKRNEPLKVILLGKRGVGKSTLYLRIRDGKFYDDVHNQTLDYLDKTISLNNNMSVEMRLFDTANMEWHEGTVTRSYYLESRVALIVYSVEDMDSADDLKNHIQEVKSHAANAKLFLIRNKIDLEDHSVEESVVDGKLTKAGYPFDSKCKFSVSSVSGDGVEGLIEAIGQVLIKQPANRHDSTRHSLKSYYKEKPKNTESHQCHC